MRDTYYKMLTIKRILIVLFVLQANTEILLVRAAQSGTRSPKEFIKDFVKIEMAGGRLTTEGRLKTCSFFVRASPFEAHPKMLVVGPKYLVWDPVVPAANGKTQIDVEIDPKGFIDSKLKFAPMGQQFMKNSAVYNLVFAEANERSNPDCKSNGEVDEQKHWIIDGPNDILIITIDAAKHYLDSERNKLTDAIIKKNAGDTIVQLSKLK